MLRFAGLGSYIDLVIDSVQHPFFMMIFGLIFWFSIVWSLDRNKLKAEGKSFWDDQKDEMIVAFIGGLIFLVWDDETLSAIEYLRAWAGGVEMDNWKQPEDAQFPDFMYLLIGFFVDRAYWGIKKLRRNPHEG